MSTNDFEKRVRQKMDELNFTPSGTVWNEIEVKIRKRRERRRLLIWLPLFCLLLGSGYWAYQHYAGTNAPDKNVAIAGGNNNADAVIPGNDNNNNETNKESASVTNEISPSTKENTNAASEKQITTEEQRESIAKNKKAIIVKDSRLITTAATQNRIKQDVVRNTDAKKNIVKVNQTIIASRKPARGNNSLAKINLNGPGNKSKNKDRNGGSLVKGKDVKGNSNDEPIKGDIAQKDQQENKDVVTPVTKEDQKDVNNQTGSIIAANDNKPVADSTAKATAATTIQTDSTAVAQKKPSAKKKKIQWGVTAGSAVSGISSGGLFSQDKSLYAASNSVSGVGPGNVAGVPQFTGPSSVKPGASFFAGVNARIHLDSTWMFSAGIQYNYYSTRIEVGNKVDRSAQVAQNTAFDRSVNSYYTSLVSAQQPYTNAYHFIELPLTFEKQLGVKSRFSINMGTSVGMFINSNALHYDEQRTIYYKDNSLFNKTQVNLLAGLSWRVLQRKSFTMALTPGFKYGATNLFKKELYNSKHLFAAGLGVQVYFDKK